MATDTRPYADENRITRGFLALIANGDNARAAARSLKDTDDPIPHQTLQDWRHRYAERYQELQEQHGPEIEQALARGARLTALRAFHVTQKAVDATEEQIDSGDIRDPAGTARNLATTGAILTDKMLALTGRPTQITQHLSPDDIFKRLANKGYRLEPAHTDAQQLQHTRQLGQSRAANAGAEASSPADTQD
jgi:hypothetical protein